MSGSQDKMSQGSVSSEAGDSQNSDDCGTPSKATELRSTPQKRKVDFDFWGSGGSEKKKLNFDLGAKDAASAEENIKIRDLKPGKGLMASLQFRVTLKTAKQISKNGYDMFKFHGMDDTGEIVIVGFGEVVAKWFDIIKINHLFKLSNFDVKEENSQYRSTTGHDSEIMISLGSVLAEIDIDDESIPPIPFNFMELDEIKNTTTKCRVDTLGILVYDWGLEPVKATVKRDLSLTDETKANLIVTLWGKAAEEFDGDIHSVFAIRNGWTSPFNGTTTLNIYMGSLLWGNPSIEKADTLKMWFDDQKKPETSD